MREKLLPSIVSCVFILLAAEKVNAKPLYIECNPSPRFYATGTVDQINPISGINVSVATSVGPGGDKKNVVVFGQDPEEEGVGITVTFSPVVGDMVHNVRKWSCVKFAFDPSESYDYCGEKRSDNYYWMEECVPIRTPGAYRKVFDARVWLEPSADTVEWLGWKQGAKGGKATLRYLFPEKWMAGTWTEDGFTTTGTPDLSWSTSYYEEWVRQLQGYNFLAGDTGEINSLWSVTMVEVANPVTGGFQSLGIFGIFNLATGTYPLPSDILGGNQWRVNYWEMNKYTQLKKATCEPDPVSSIPLGADFIAMEHIPLDLPGKWFIGVQIEVSKASVWYQDSAFISTELTEEWNYPGDTQWFTNQKDYDYIKSDHYFYAFVLLSTPCNPLEQDNCIDESY